jgi:formylglycine-generating enzyme required for sulfatase activity
MMGLAEDRPQHEVTVPHLLAVGRYPVTFEEWDFAQEDKAWASAARIKPRKPIDEKWGRGRRPVIDVSWDDAKAYVNWLEHKTGQEYRLLSEAEWEYACRAGSEADWCFGDDQRELGDYAWYHGNSNGRTQPAGEKNPNLFGLHDMHGNVWEWCEDLWHESYMGKPHEVKRNGRAWTTGDSGLRVLRGGSWNIKPSFLRAATRNGSKPDLRFYGCGFRVVRTLQ